MCCAPRIVLLQVPASSPATSLASTDVFPEDFPPAARIASELGAGAASAQAVSRGNRQRGSQSSAPRSPAARRELGRRGPAAVLRAPSPSESQR